MSAHLPEKDMPEKKRWGKVMANWPWTTTHITTRSKIKKNKLYSI
jgi:hypothetical protein